MRLTIRRKFSLGLCAVVGGLMAAVMTVVDLSITQAVHGKLRGDLRAARQVFEEFQRLRFAQLLANTRMAAEVPYFKAVMTTPDLDHATRLESALAAQELIQSALLLVSDSDGRLLASATEPQRAGEDVAANPAFASALRGEPFQEIWVTDEGIYQVVASPLVFGDEIAGALVAGFAIDRAVLETVAKMTNCQVAMVSPQRVETSAGGERLLRAWPAGLPAEEPGQVLTRQLNGAWHLLVGIPVGSGPVLAVLGRSLEEELTPYRRLQRGLLGVAGVLLLVALLLGLLYARRITQPIQALVTGTQRIAAGDFASPVAIASTDEIGELARAFNQMGRELEHREVQLRRAERLKDELLNVFSHELRSPVTTIREGMSLLADGSLGPTTPAQREFIDTIARNGERLDKLFGKALIVTEILAGRLDYAFAPMDLRQVVNTLEATFRPMAETRGVKLQVTRSGQPVSCLGDAKRLTEALGELVENAIQATPTDSMVTLSWSSTSDGTEIGVQDAGRSIPQEELPALFERFRWVGGIDERKTGGLGLGLFIAKAIVEAHGGSLSAESAPGQGTRMTVRMKAPPTM